MTDEPKVTLEISLSQAETAVAAFDLYARIVTGQIEEVADLLRFGVLVPHESSNLPRRTASVEQIEAVESAMKLAKAALDFPSNGSFGIGHPHADISAKRAWEMKKSLAKALAERRDPTPSFRGVDYDGNFVRWTDDPEPVTSISVPEASNEPKGP